MFINLGPPEIGIRKSLEECIQLARKAGFRGVDVDIFEVKRLVNQKGTSYIKELFHKYQLNIGGWIWFDDFGFESDPSSFNDHLKVLPSLAAVAEQIGASRVLSWILSYSDDLNFEENFNLHAERLKTSGKILGDYGQRLALEYIGPKTFRENHQYEFVSTLDGILRLINEVGLKNVGLLMDSWHWYTSHENVGDLKKIHSDNVFYVHLSDAPPDTPVDKQVDNLRRLPGSTGVVDNVSFLMALNNISYDGPITAEPFSQEVNALPPEDAARMTAEALSKLLDKAGVVQRNP
ncbi:sugar phosphate isomerase/epimerase family protein [Chloroflexota bacterium]